MMSFSGVLIVEFTGGKEDSGKTVLHILSGVLGLSRGMIKHLKFIDDGIMLGSKKVTVRAVVSEGDVLYLNTESERESKIDAVDLPLAIAYEDEDVVIPDKPPFMPTHPSHDHHGDTVANALAYRYRDCEKAFVFRPVNRLDRNTSGLLIIARSRIAAGKLYESMLRKEIRKKYIAILEGVPKEKSGTISGYIKRSAESIIVRRVCGENEGGDEAITEYRVLADNGRQSVVLAEPITGRTHQLRVHFSSIGCPIVGDDIYGSESELISRHALHAASLRFKHPSKDEYIELFSPLHEDMRLLYEKLFGDEVLNYE